MKTKLDDAAIFSGGKVYINPKAPQALRDLLNEACPDNVKRLSREEAEKLLDS